MKMLKYKKLMSVMVLAIMVMVSPVSHAVPLVNSLFVNGTNQIEDTDVDRFFGVRDGVLRQLTGSDTLAQGDIIQSILNFTNTNGVPIAANGGIFSAPYGLLAYSELVVGPITNLGGGLQTFNVSANAASAILTGGALVNLYEHTAGSLVTLFSSAPATGIATVTTGSGPVIASFGLNGTADFWQVKTPSGTLAALLSATPGSGQAGLYEFGLSVLANNGLPIALDSIVSNASGHAGTFHDVVGDGSAFARSPGTNAGWAVSTNTTVAFNNVPEPELLVLLSVGLLTGGVAARRRSM